MARPSADHLADHDVTHVVASSLLRAQETAAPVAEAHGMPITTDDRVIEAGNSFEGQRVGDDEAAGLRPPAHWSKLVNPLRPSWGEAYAEIAERMAAAIADARVRSARPRGRHRLPPAARSGPPATPSLGKRLWHDPRKRECRLASLTTLTYVGDDLESITYCEPAAALLAQSQGGTG